jgi:hypothetical protein
MYHLMAWDQSYLKELAEAARNGSHINTETSKRLTTAASRPTGRTLRLKQKPARKRPA